MCNRHLFTSCQDLASKPILRSTVPVHRVHGASRLPTRERPNPRPLLLLSAGALQWREDQINTRLSHRHPVPTRVYGLVTGYFRSSIIHVFPASLPPGVALQSGTADRVDISLPLVCWGFVTPSERAVSDTHHHHHHSATVEEGGLVTRNEGPG